MARALTRLLAAAAAIALAATAETAEARPLSALYPALDPAIIVGAARPLGYSAVVEGTPRLLPAGEAGAAVLRALEGRKSSFLVETLVIAKGVGAGSKLELYDSMTRYRGLSGVTYRSKSQGEGTVLFSEVARISDPRKPQPLPDEAASSLPERAQHFIRLKDANFGTCYYEVLLDTRGPGIALAMSNARPLSYLFVPVVGEGGLFCVFYVEPVSEGLLIYGISGGTVSGLAAKQVNLPSAVRKRAAAIAGWLASGL
jgi:hypothetical protein